MRNVLIKRDRQPIHVKVQNSLLRNKNRKLNAISIAFIKALDGNKGPFKVYT